VKKSILAFTLALFLMLSMALPALAADDAASTDDIQTAVEATTAEVILLIDGEEYEVTDDGLGNAMVGDLGKAFRLNRATPVYFDAEKKHRVLNFRLEKGDVVFVTAAGNSWQFTVSFASKDDEEASEDFTFYFPVWASEDARVGRLISFKAFENAVIQENIARAVAAEQKRFDLANVKPTYPKVTIGQAHREEGVLATHLTEDTELVVKGIEYISKSDTDDTIAIKIGKDWYSIPRYVLVD
jgi:hypothetical protein